MNWSTSKLSLIRLCPFAFLLDLRGVAAPPHPALDGGSYAHDAIRAFVRACVDGDPLDVHAIARRTVPGREQDRADVLAMLTLMQEEVIEGGDPVTAKSLLYQEERLAMPVGPHTFDGQPDLVQRFGRTCVIDDYKTHWRPETQEAFEADEQLPRYALLVDANHPGEFDRFIIRKRFVRYRGAVRERELGREQLEAVRWSLVDDIEEATLLLEHYLAIEPAVPATPGDWCSVCRRTDVCPALERLDDRVVAAIANDADAYQAAALVRVMDAHSAKLKRLLKAYLGAEHRTGRVELAGGSYGFGPAKRKAADVKDVVDIYAAHERPLNLKALRVDVDQLRRGLDREPGALRRTMLGAIAEFEVADCRYRRGDGVEELNEEEEEAR